MLKYFLCLVLLTFSININAQTVLPDPVPLMRAADQNEDNAEVRPKYIEVLNYVLKNGELSDSLKTQVQGTINRLELVGRPLELYGKDLSGNDLCLCFNEYQNKVVIIDFWASWCSPCRAEILKIKPIVAKYEGDVEVLGVNLDENPANAVKAKIQMGVTWKNFRKTKEIEEIIEKYNITAIPRVLLIGPDGKVVLLDVHSGNLENEIRKLLGKEPIKYYPRRIRHVR